MRNVWLAIVISSLLNNPATVRADEISRADLLADLEKVVASYKAIEARNYHARVRCPEIEAVFAAGFSASMGMPLPWQPGFILVSSSSDRRFEADVESVPEPFREKARAKIKSLGSGYFRVMEKGTPFWVAGFMKAVSGSAKFDVISADAQTAEFEFNELNEPFVGKRMRSVRLKIDRQAKTFERGYFNFANDEFIKMKFHHQSFELPDHTKVLLMDRVDCEQTAFTTGTHPLPPKVTMFFEDYQFTSTNETQTPPALKP